MRDTNKKRRVNVYLIAILAVFLVLQVAAVFMYGDNYYLGDLAQMDNNDDVKYIRTAINLIETSKLMYQDGDIKSGVPTVFIMPGYPIFLAFFIKIFGLTGGLLAVRIVQGLLQAGIILLLYLIGRKYFNEWIARLASAMYVLYIPNISVSLLVLTETVFTFLFVLLIYLCFEAIETKRMRYYVWGGIVLGLAVMIRPTVLVFPAVVLILWLLKKYTFREMLKRALVVGCILMVFLVPWWIRNAIHFDRFIPLTAASGNPFAQGAVIGYGALPHLDSSDPDKARTELGDEWVEAMLSGDSMKVDQAEMELGKVLFRNNWQENPWATMGWYTFGKLICFWVIPFYESPHQYFESAIDQETFRVPFVVMTAYHWLLLLAAGLGTVLLFRKGQPRRRLKLLLPASIFIMCVVYLPYFTMPRYAYPLMPLIMLLAAGGIYTVWRRLRDRGAHARLTT
jgi:4-amino-4-deoxy-L-arabinose transferase-like glycosyltransferase